jgi:hypothetical protein
VSNRRQSLAFFCYCSSSMLWFISTPPQAVISQLTKTGDSAQDPMAGVNECYRDVTSTDKSFRAIQEYFARSSRVILIGTGSPFFLSALLLRCLETRRYRSDSEGTLLERRIDRTRNDWWNRTRTLTGACPHYGAMPVAPLVAWT